MKKLFATLAAAILFVAAVTPVSAKAQTLLISPKPADQIVYVTIANGDLKLVQEPVKLKDVDGDGALTVNDALVLAHSAKYDGRDTGYASANSSWGLSLTKLWGIENGGSYGYYVNNVSSMSLEDKVKDGDFITAFVYTDTVGFSDKYTFFDVNTVSAKAGQNITLTLTGAGYDANWNPVNLPVAGATITVDGKETTYKTDVNGKVTLSLSDANAHVISAVSSTETLVPAACVANSSISVSAAKTEDGTTNVIVFLSFILICGLIVVGFFVRKLYEK